MEGCENKAKILTDLEVFNRVNNLDLKGWNDTEKIEEIENLVNESLENVTFSINLNQLTVTPNCVENIKDNCSENNTYSYTKTCEFSFNQTLELKLHQEGELCQVFTENKILIKPIPLDFLASITTIHEPLSF